MGNYILLPYIILKKINRNSNKFLKNSNINIYIEKT